MMNLWSISKGKIAVVAVLAAIALYKVNKQNVQNFHDFVTDNNLEETFDEWGQFGLDIRVRADDPSSIVPMSKKNQEEVSKALDEEITVEREPLFKDTTTMEKVGIVLLIIPTYLMVVYVVIRSILDPKKREEWAAISNPDKPNA
jgi:hypothetical protein